MQVQPVQNNYSILNLQKSHICHRNRLKWLKKKTFHPACRLLRHALIHHHATCIILFFGNSTRNLMQQDWLFGMI